MNGDLQHEKQLLLRVRTGDQGAYAAIYEHYHAGLYQYTLRFVKLPDLAEDLVHDVFLKLWEVRDRIDPERSVAGYLYRISRNHVFKTMARINTDRSLRLRLMLRFGETTTPPQEEASQLKEYEELLAMALTTLPPQRRRVFRLCREEGKTYEETATILSISRNAVKKHIVLGMRDVYEYIQRNGDLTLLLFLLDRLL
jgi:RNA polymerase sigma-70 factor (family 1)